MAQGQAGWHRARFSRAGQNPVDIYSIGAGLTLSSGTLTNDLLTGKASGQTVTGGVAAGENLTLRGTSHASPGKVVASDPVVLPLGAAANCALQFPGSPGTGLVALGTADNFSVFVAGSERLRFRPANIAITDTVNFQASTAALFNDSANVSLGTSTGTKLGTATGQKLGFWGATPVVQQVLATGAGRTVDDVITFLQLIGLCKQA